MHSRCPPPKRFRPAGTILWARPSPTAPPFARGKMRRVGRRAQGMKYEKRGHEYFQGLYGDFYISNPWFVFQEEETPAPRWCQPDALLFNPAQGKIHILEFKYQHTSDAWWQLRQLYFPVIRSLFPAHLWDIALCEVVKWYDPAVTFPENIVMAKEPNIVLAGRLGVHIWKP